MSIRGEAHIAGIYEHPEREIPNESTAEVHGDVIAGALDDAGLEKDDVDSLYITWPEGMSTVSMADYLGMNELSYVDSTNTGGSSYIVHVGHAAAAIKAGKADVAVISLAGRPRQGVGGGGGGIGEAPEASFENVYGTSILGMYGMAASRHMAEYGTTEEQLAEIRVAASQHAQYNEDAMFQDPVTVEDVVNSRYVSDPLKLLDSCVISDGGGAFVMVSPEVAESLDRECPVVLGHGEAPKHHDAGDIDLTYTGAVWSGPRAFEEAGVTHDDIDYASIYDSFTITVLQEIEDLGFCEKGEGGEFVEGGTLRAPDGDLPFNTDGGGLSNNHPSNQGGMTKVIEAIRQLRGETNPEVQVPDCEVALAHGTGGRLGTQHMAATTILGTEGYL